MVVVIAQWKEKKKEPRKPWSQPSHVKKENCQNKILYGVKKIITNSQRRGEPGREGKAATLLKVKKQRDKHTLISAALRTSGAELNQHILHNRSSLRWPQPTSSNPPVAGAWGVG